MSTRAMADIKVTSLPSVPQSEAAPETLPSNSPTPSSTPKKGSEPGTKAGNAAPKPLPLWKIYTLPIPIRTYPLPSFYPTNPLSLAHLVYTWMSQALFPPSREPSTVHQATWSPKTRSIHVTDPTSIRALWEQGFYGKGNYSRSDPNWLKREQARRGAHSNHVAESFTLQRRNERRQMKWDRARKEQEAILRTRIEEAWVAPVGPKELLALPNSQSDLEQLFLTGTANGGILEDAANGDIEPTAFSVGKLPSVQNGELHVSKAATSVNGPSSAEDDFVTAFPEMNGHSDQPPHDKTSTSLANGSSEEHSPLKRRKSVRFSPKVDSTTFQHSDPPSPSLSIVANGNGKVPDGILTKGSSPPSKDPSPLSTEVSAVPPATVEALPSTETVPPKELTNIEHLQLTLEETFFLTFGLGVLNVKDETSGTSLTVDNLFTLFRQYSYFPPRTVTLQPDDPFLFHYAVYHHFRSLGWVTRPGIKFGCDWMLYNRGPPFSHAEFALIVLPSYSDPYWKAQGRKAQRKSWHWLHALNRVQSVAFKTLILVYVDIPPPVDGELDIPSILKRYRIREFQVRRWLSNRNRDIK